jgi:hypothetical protein
MTYLKLESFYVSGPAITTVTMEYVINGVTVSMARPFVRIGDGLAVTPVIKPTDTGLHVHTDRWTGMRLTQTRVVVLPLSMVSDAEAMRVTREFDRDPGIAWTAPDTEILAWCTRWVERRRAGERS